MANPQINTSTKVSKVSVALSPREIKIVKRLEGKLGLNFSSALRIVIREWDEYKPNGNGKVHLVGASEPVAMPAANVSAVEEKQS